MYDGLKLHYISVEIVAVGFYYLYAENVSMFMSEPNNMQRWAGT